MMMKMRFVAITALAIAMAGCAHKPTPYDYTAFTRAKPATLLVLPPVNDSPEVKASPAVWAQATMPLS
jgi:hypothetical protein